MFKKIIFSLISAALFFTLAGCSKKEPANVVTVGTIAGPETQLMVVAKKVALKRYGLHVKIVTFSDYITPNIALSQGNIDANAYQDMPFLKDQIKQHGYKLVTVGKTFIYPMGLYSKKYTKLSQIPDGARIAVPNDPSNEARSLLMLQHAGLIKLKKDAGVNATPIDVISNPKYLQFVELGAPELPRALSDVAAAAINTTYAMPAGLKLSDALFKEDETSLYYNIIVTRTADKNLKKIKELVAAFQSKPVIKEAKKLFGDAAIPAWK